MWTYAALPLIRCACRLAADVFNDLAIFLELLAPFFPGFFLLIVCSATLSRVSYLHTSNSSLECAVELKFVSFCS